MPKPDPALLDPAHYPYECEIAVRISDIDVNRHVNNVALVDIFQEGRGHFLQNKFGAGQGGDYTLMVVHLTVDFVGEGKHGSPLFSRVGIAALGRSSLTLNQLIVQNDSVIAIGTVVLVSVRNGRPAPHSDDFVNEAMRWMMAQ